MTIAVVVDSTAAVPKDMQETFGIRVVPLHLMWDREEYADGRDITITQFYERMKTAENWPTTDGAVQGEFYDVFEELKGKVDGVVAVLISPDTPSTGYQSALIAKDMVEGIPIEVVNSHRTIVAEGLVATAAAQAARAGANLQEVVKVAESVIPKTHIFFNVGSISYFLRLGRIGESEVEKKEDSHIITIHENGKIAPLEKYPTQEEARRRLRDLVKENARKDTPLHAAVFHAAALEEAEEFKKEIEAEYNCAEIWIGEASPIIAIHVSPDTLGIAFYNE